MCFAPPYRCSGFTIQTWIRKRRRRSTRTARAVSLRKLAWLRPIFIGLAVANHCRRYVGIWAKLRISFIWWPGKNLPRKRAILSTSRSSCMPIMAWTHRPLVRASRFRRWATCIRRLRLPLAHSKGRYMAAPTKVSFICCKRLVTRKTSILTSSDSLPRRKRSWVLAIAFTRRSIRVRPICGRWR